MRIAVLNAGSATAKAALFEVDPDGARCLGRGAREVSGAGGHAAAFRAVLEQVGASSADLDAIGHRIVFGGRGFSAPARIDAEVERAIEALSRIAPQHNHPALEGIRVARTLHPGRPEVAVFDTAFHGRRPPESLRYALPWDLCDSLGFFRHGFHGIAHESLVGSLAEAQGGGAEGVTAVTLQLGAGCSACAVENGRSIETSMGFSPLEGLPMATRCGDLDPSVVLELVEAGRPVAEVRELLTRRSGLAGLAGDADLRAVLAAAAAGGERAGVAVSLFVRRIVTTVGAYLTLLGGRGAIVFGGGIGANAAEIRSRVAAGLAAWNVALDAARNEEPAVRGSIAAAGARPVYVFETDEEQRIAGAVHALLAGTPR
jgi:acetate kinase